MNRLGQVRLLDQLQELADQVFIAALVQGVEIDELPEEIGELVRDCISGGCSTDEIELTIAVAQLNAFDRYHRQIPIDD